jgi:hypothetical protein
MHAGFTAMKKLILLTLALTISTLAFAADTKPIEDVFQRYWGAYSKKDFVKAAADVLPSDLDDVKKALLPVFLEGQASRDKEVQEMVAAFFGRTVGKSRETMTAQEVFAGMNRLVNAASPDLFESLKQASVSIIFVRKLDDDNAEIHFQITTRGESDTDVEALKRSNGRWWMRVNEQPQEIAAHFKAVMAKKS